MLEIRDMQMGQSMLAVIDGRVIGTAKKTPRGWHVRCRVGKPFTVPEGAIVPAGEPTHFAEVSTKRAARKALYECAALANA